MKKFRAFVLILLAVALAMVFWQQKTIERLRADNTSVRSTTSELEQLRAENERLLKMSADADELAKLRGEHSELIRLRGETSRLRQQLKTQTAAIKPVEKTSAATNQPPAEKFTTDIETDISPGQLLVAGGWKTSDGRRTFVLAETTMVDEAGNLMTAEQARLKGEKAQVVFQTKFVEMDDNALQNLGMENRFSGNGNDHLLLNTGQAEFLFQQMTNMAGIDVLSAPNMLTLNGRQAQVSVLDTAENGVVNDQTTGHVVDFLPQVSADGKSIRLKVNATVLQRKAVR